MRNKKKNSIGNWELYPIEQSSGQKIQYVIHNFDSGVIRPVSSRYTKILNKLLQKKLLYNTKLFIIEAHLTSIIRKAVPKCN